MKALLLSKYRHLEIAMVSALMFTRVELDESSPHLVELRKGVHQGKIWKLPTASAGNSLTVRVVASLCIIGTLEK